jgi:hypothetical protein
VPMSPRDRRALIIFGVVAVVAVAAYFLLLKPGGGGNEQPAAQSAPSPSTASPKPAPSVKAKKKSNKHTPRRSRQPGPLVGGHDPFSPLINASAGGGTGPAPSGGGTSPAPSGGSSSTPPTVSPAGSPPATPSGGTGTRVGGHNVTLIDVFTRDGEQKAQIAVDGRVFVVGEGEDFDGNFRLVSVTGGCARILFGDQSFLLCENPQK